MKHGMITLLSGGDFRSNAQAKIATKKALQNHSLIKELVRACGSSNALVRMRAADSLEALSGHDPRLLQPFKKTLLGKITLINQQEVRWHVAQILPRLSLSKKETQKAWKVLKSWYADKHEKSRIVKVFSLDSMARLSVKQRPLKAKTERLVKQAVRSPIFSIRARAKKLLKYFS
jgi:hypothetical protein